jgi:hypothetical protein
VSQISKLATGLTATAFTMTAVVLSPVVAADPTIPLDPGQLPGLEAVQSLSPIIQQAAVTPSSAQQLLLAAASQLAGNATTPAGSAALADAVTRFVQDGGPASLASALPSGALPSGALPSGAVPSGALPSGAVAQQSVSGLPHGTMPLMTPGTGNGPIPLELHVPAPGAIPGTEAHLPAGIDPANAAGPAAGTMPEVSRMVSPAAPVAQTAAPVDAATPAAVSAPVAAPSFDPNSPPTQDFMYPSISSGCLKDGGNVIAAALSVAGPAKIPTPGPGPGQTAYVFTAVGTPAPAAEQKLPLNVTWVNLTTGRSGSATLKPNPGINPEGPTTLTAIVDTGAGSIMSTIFGQVTTVDKQCTFMPTIGSSVVP